MPNIWYSVGKNHINNTDDISIGDIIEVPWRNKRTQAIVWNISENIEVKYEIKNIGEILAKKVISPLQKEYVESVSKYFFCSIGSLLSKAVPLSVRKAGFNKPTQKQYFLSCFSQKDNKESDESRSKLDKILQSSTKKAISQQKILNYLQENKKLKDGEIKKLDFSRPALNDLMKQGIVEYKEINKYLENNTNAKENIGINDTKSTSSIFSSLENQALGFGDSAKNKELLNFIFGIVENKKQVLFICPDQLSLLQLKEKFEILFTKHYPKYLDLLITYDSKSSNTHNYWKIRRGKAQIILGLENTLFARFKNLGGVILHEYSQSLSTRNYMPPFFHGAGLLKKITDVYKIPVIYSSVCGASFAKDMKSIVFSSQRAEKKIIDMNVQEMSGNKSILSLPVQESIKNTLENNNQVIIFLNRKGVHHSLLCKNCGYTPISPFSGTKMGMFKDAKGNTTLRCHQSGFTQAVPHTCPKCASSLSPIGIGTQGIEQEIKKYFPKASLFRADSDSLSTPKEKKEFLQKMNIDRINDNQNENNDEKIDILITTQITLGCFSFPHASLAIDISADNALLFPFYDAEERGLRNQYLLENLLGSSSDQKEILIQTFMPMYPYFQQRQQISFLENLSQEYPLRAQLFYPPYTQRITLYKEGKNTGTLEKHAKTLFEYFTKTAKKVFPPKIRILTKQQKSRVSLECFFENETDIQKIIDESPVKGLMVERKGE